MDKNVEEEASKINETVSDETENEEITEKPNDKPCAFPTPDGHDCSLFSTKEPPCSQCKKLDYIMTAVGMVKGKGKKKEAAILQCTPEFVFNAMYKSNVTLDA